MLSTCRSWRTWPLGVSLCGAGGPIFPREGTLCGAWWAIREVELSTARCMQVTFLGGEGCGRCIFDLPVTKTDPQALGKKRTHACACSATVVAGGGTLCPVKVARKLYHGAFHHCPDGAHPIPEMRPLWPTVDGQFVSKRAATLTFQKLAALTGTDARITGHACRVTGAQALAVAGVDIWLIQAFCRWGSRAVLEYVRDAHFVSSNRCRCQSDEGVAVDGSTRKPLSTHGSRCWTRARNGM